MLAIDCPCGHLFKAETSEELFRLCRDHVDRDHPEMARTDEQILARVQNEACEVAA